MPRPASLSMLLCSLALAGCAHTLDEAANTDPYAGAQVMVGSSGMVRLPSDWDDQRLLTTRKVANGILTEEIVLANATNSPRENWLRVQTRWRGNGTVYGFANEMESPFGSDVIEKRLAVEFMSAAPDLEPLQRRNRQGPYLYVQTQTADDETCIYAWQFADAMSELRAETHVFAVDLRLCHPTEKAAQLLALFDAFELEPRL